MGTSSSKTLKPPPVKIVKMKNETKLLNEFREYEVDIYLNLFGSPYIKEEIDFYFIPKQYIINLCQISNYSGLFDELNQLLIYSKAEKMESIRENIIMNLNNLCGDKITLGKIENMSVVSKYDKEKDIFYMKFEPESGFIPLKIGIWKLFNWFYKSDIVLTKKGFLNDGEIFILTENEFKIDCFFTLYDTKDLIYHFCFKMRNYKEYEDFHKYFREQNDCHSARYLLLILKIDIKNQKTFKQFEMEIYNNIQNIAKYRVTIYFFGTFKFTNSEDSNFNYFKQNNPSLIEDYKKHNEKINKLANNYKIINNIS
jgi:hypothetical protein